MDEAKDAERYSRRLSRRIREGYASKRTKQADPGGHAPFGFRRNEAKLIEPDPDRIELVRRMFELASVGTPDREVSEHVGVPLFTVRGVLSSPLYIGRLRDGSKAHWPPIISPELWDAVVAERAKRATNAGRPASPRRPYALDMLYCAACGKRLTSDTGFYRHHDACDGFKAAVPEWPASWKGRRDGKAHRRELFEEAIGVLLDRVSVKATVVARVVGDVVPAEHGPDVTTLRRIEQECAAAASRVLKDRDYAGLQRTIERLDREEQEARRPRQREGVPAERAVEYLQALGDAWRLAEGGPGRAMVARSVFERLEASGFRELKVHLTEEARAHAFAAAVPAHFTASVGYDRGERICADYHNVAAQQSRPAIKRESWRAVSAPPCHDAAMTETVDPAASQTATAPAPRNSSRRRPTGEPSMAREPNYETSRPAKIAIVGVGLVGSTFAYTLLLSGIASEIVLIDLNRGRAEGEAMDLNHAVPFAHPTKICTGDYADCEGAAITVIAAGTGQKPGETRLDLVKRNAAIFGQIVPRVAEANPEGIIVVATNPVDVLTYVTLNLAGLPAHRVFGSGTILDTARFRYMLSEHLGVDPRSVHAYIIGEHGDSEVPVWSLANVAGMRLRSFCAKNGIPLGPDTMERIFRQTRDAAYEIISRKGATYYAVAAGLMRITEAILRDQNTVLSISSLVTDYYGIDDVCLSLPTVVSRRGIERVLRLDLSPREARGVRKSAEVLRATIESLGAATEPA